MALMGVQQAGRVQRPDTNPISVSYVRGAVVNMSVGRFEVIRTAFFGPFTRETRPVAQAGYSVLL